MLGTAKTDCLLLGKLGQQIISISLKQNELNLGWKCVHYSSAAGFTDLQSFASSWFSTEHQWAPSHWGSSLWAPESQESLENDQLFKSINLTNLSIPYFFFRTRVSMRKFIEAIGICIVYWESSVWGCKIANFQFWGHRGRFSVLSALCNTVEDFQF